MRLMNKMWAGLTASRTRRIIVCLSLLCLLLTVQIFTQRSARTDTTIIETSDNQRQLSIEQQLTLQTQKSDAEGAGIGAEPVTALQQQTTTQAKEQKKETPTNKIRADIIENLVALDTKTLQKVWRFLDSTRDPHAVHSIRIDQALQALKIHLLEEVSGKKYPDIMDAVQNARAVTTQPRPKSMQVVISTTWRSGSTFLEELLASHPAVYNHYEPLLQFGLKQIRDGPESDKAQTLVHSLLSCKYDAQKEYLNTARKIREMFNRNTVLWQSCASEDWGDALCYNEIYLEGACKLFPWTTMKLVRLRLKLLRPVLEDKSLNTRIIYLVRDPRAVMNSRIDTVRWCNAPDCNDPGYLCNDMDDDLTAALQLEKEFPGHVYIMRYEDMALDPFAKTQELLNYLGLDFDPKMDEFLKSHTTKNYDKPWSTSRESKTRVTYWVSKIAHDTLQYVQASCSPVMQKFGYLPINSTSSVAIENILAPVDFTKS